MENRDKLIQFLRNSVNSSVLNVRIISKAIHGEMSEAALKATERAVIKSVLHFHPLNDRTLVDEHQRPAKQLVLNQLIYEARKKRKLVLFAQMLETNIGNSFLALNDARSRRRWIRLGSNGNSVNALQCALNTLCGFEQKDIILIPSGALVEPLRKLIRQHGDQCLVNQVCGSVRVALEIYSHGKSEILQTSHPDQQLKSYTGMTHLDRLEAESLHVMREAIAEAESPVMLYSLGKDSSVMLHLARKAFYPSPPPFPLLHVDTRWKFQAMYDFRDYMARKTGMELLVHINPDGVAKNINPLDHGSELHTDIMKTQSLKMALDHYQFDLAFGGARRDEEKSRAKERIFSFRTSSHYWDPKNQRPELWNLYNGKKNKGETIRVFPISNWTELDIWQYIYREQIPIVPLYFAAERPVVERDGMLVMVDDDRLLLHSNETIHVKKIRFRTLGCYPLTGAIESEADNLASIILELLSVRTSERHGRKIDADYSASMEKKKQEGYF